MEKLKESIEKILINDYLIEANKNLLYKIIVGETLKYEPHDPKNPKRGQYSFQTDLLISKKKITYH